jgi:thymidylate synthase (FAD)
MNPYTDPYSFFPKLHPQELRGTEGMKVTVIDHSSNPYQAMLTGQGASYRPWDLSPKKESALQLLDGIRSGKIWAGQMFEAPTFTFAIENVSRALTHQLVRVRVGAGFMQESGREGTWGKCSFITPLTILENDALHHRYIEMMAEQIELYEEMKVLGIPPQDARFEFGHAVAQNMWVTINFAALMNWCNKRLCTTMQWEINTLARMIRDEVTKLFPHLGILLKSTCEKKGGCVMMEAYRNSDMAIYYQPGAKNNGNKVYFPLEGTLCGKAGILSEGAVTNLLIAERTKLEME